MKLLVTNDDGIDSGFLHVLIAALRTAGHDLFIAVPADEQSWTGASKTRNRAVRPCRVERGFGGPTWTLDGTPADCVNIAPAHLLPGEKFDGVVSGMNVGFNCSLGFIFASGTVAGAWEGALHGLPAIAFSQDVSEELYAHLKEQGREPDAALTATLAASSAHAARLVGELLPGTPANSFTIHSVNFPHPCAPDTPVRRTVPAQVHVPGLFSPAADDGSHRLVWGNVRDVSPPGALTDTDCLLAGEISHSVLDFRKLGR